MNQFNMAAAKAKANSLETFSRFSVLGIESEEEEEEKKAAEKNSNAEKNSKKRARKKKKAANAQNANELRNLAFHNPISSAAIQSIHQKNHTIPVKNINSSTLSTTYQGSAQHLQGGATSKDEKTFDNQARNIATENIDQNFNAHSWEEWKNKDESYIVDQFQRDLQAALRLSAQETKQLNEKLPAENKHVKKKHHKKATMSLEEFSQLTSTESHMNREPSLNKQPILNGYCPEELDPYHFEYQPVPDEAPSRASTENKKSKKKKKKQATENKTTLSHLNAVDNKTVPSHNVVQQEDNSLMDATSLVVYQNEVEEKNKEILRLQQSNIKLVEELARVKKRNKQLCFILAQGEMKEKAEILFQVDELNNVKNELSTELEGMYSALERERTKVTILKQELQKYQGSRAHSKSVSEDM